MKEIWKDIKGYEGLYQVSNLGEIRSLDHTTIIRDDKKNRVYERRKKGRILKPFSSKRGYLKVTLTKNKKTKDVKIHRIVATTFLDNPLNKRDINHKNGIKTDNRIVNLEWATHQENMQHAFKTGLISKFKKIKIKQYDIHGKFIKEYESISEASRELNIKIAGLSKSLKSGNHKYKGFLWEYADKKQEKN